MTEDIWRTPVIPLLFPRSLRDLSRVLVGRHNGLPRDNVLTKAQEQAKSRSRTCFFTMDDLGGRCRLQDFCCLGRPALPDRARFLRPIRLQLLQLSKLLRIRPS